MEKLLTRGLLNRNQIVNKKRRVLEKELRKSWREYNRGKNMQKTEFDHMLKRERKARREDWMLGPLAPKRDIGENKEKFGSIDSILVQPPRLPTREISAPTGRGFEAVGREDNRRPGFEDGEWKGEGLMGNLVEGDRVCVIKGRMDVVGKIGKVVKIQTESNYVFVQGVNKADTQVPAQAKHQAKGEKTFAQELPIHISNLRLVATARDTETGKLKDVLIRRVHGAGPYEQRPYGSSAPRHTRYVQHADGTSEVFPWPEQEIDRFVTQAPDTVRSLVEEVTYQPSINDEMPLEEGVVDELRSKHARKRTDWDDLDLLRKKMMIDARKDWFQLRSQILSQPFWTKEYMVRARKETELAGKQQQQVPAI